MGRDMTSPEVTTNNNGDKATTSKSGEGTSASMKELEATSSLSAEVTITRMTEEQAINHRTRCPKEGKYLFHVFSG